MMLLIVGGVLVGLPVLSLFIAVLPAQNGTMTPADEKAATILLIVVAVLAPVGLTMVIWSLLTSRRRRSPKF